MPPKACTCRSSRCRAQLLSVDIADQERYIDLQRMRARQIWDECKHSNLHADVLLGKGWIKDERELMDIAQANTQPLPAYFGLSMMFPHIHPLARAAQNYYQEANACIGIMAYLDRVDDPLVRHEHLSQRDEELMHFMEGKFQIDFLLRDAGDAAAGRGRARLPAAPGRRHPVRTSSWSSREASDAAIWPWCSLADCRSLE